MGEIRAKCGVNNKKDGRKLAIFLIDFYLLLSFTFIAPRDISGPNYITVINHYLHETPVISYSCSSSARVFLFINGRAA